MKYLYRWLGCEIVFVHVGHGLLGLGVIGVLALHVPWWFFLALTPVFALSALGWMGEASLVMPVARRYLSGDPYPGQAGGRATTGTATTPPRGG